VLGPLLPVVHQILEGDATAPRKQRHTAVRICRRLRLFDPHSCRVRRPNVTGHVETPVGFTRRNSLVLVPALHGGLEGLNARLEDDCRADLARLRG
jgi:hypothetical protein